MPHEAFQQKPDHSTKERSSLNCVSLRSELDYEVTWGAVKGQDKRPLRDALDSSPSHQWRFMHLGKEFNNKDGRHVGLDFYDLLIRYTFGPDQ